MHRHPIIAELFRRRSTTPRPDLSFMFQMAERMGNPQNRFKTIHVAGTNGKGSVSLKIATVLENLGYKVGLFTSPHIHSYCERVAINRRSISENDVIKFIEKVFAAAPEAMFFELTTLMALTYFQEQHVDIAVIETGIGGALDPTNIVHPELSLITSIGFDHKELLGDTLDAIAREKGGIIKPDVPVVLGPSANIPVLHSIAARQQASLYQIDPQPGFYDLENQAIAKKGLELLGCKQFPGIDIRPPCRFEVRGRLILDVAHNPAGIARLLEAYDLHFPGEPFTVVAGVSQDKDVETIVQLLAPKASHLYLVEPISFKPYSPFAMGELLRQNGYTHFTAGLTISEAIKTALRREERTVVCGSFYIMQQVNDVLRVEISQDELTLDRS